MDVNSASNLREKVKTEKDVKREHGVEKKKRKNKMQKRLEANQGKGKFQRGFLLSQRRAA